MSIRNSLIWLALGSFFLILAGCGGGGSDGGGGGDGGGDGNGAAARVTLSGSLGLKTSATTAPRLAAKGVALREGLTPQATVIVIALDASGNSFTTTTDRAGAFTFSKDDAEGLSSGTDYALVFIDTKTLEVIGSLVTSTDGVGMLQLAGDTTISEVLIDTETKRASIKDETITVVDGSALDDDGDGVITQDDITAVQVKTADSSGVDALKTLPVVSFFGELNTWTMEKYRDDNGGWVGNLCWNMDPTAANYPPECATPSPPQIDVSFTMVEEDIALVVPAQVMGPNGELVNATKMVELPYRVEDVPDSSFSYTSIVDSQIRVNAGDIEGWNQGYASGTQADLNVDATTWGNEPGGPGFWSPYLDTTLGAPPGKEFSQKMGIWSWAEYRYVDAVNGIMTTGEKRKNDAGQIEIDWGLESLPLNLPMGKDIPLNEEFVEDIWDEESQTNVAVTVKMSQTINVGFATKGDGSLAKMTESGTGGKDLPIVHIKLKIASWSISDGTVTIDQSTSQTIIDALPLMYRFIVQEMTSRSGGECFFILGKYGIEADDYDGDCSTTSDWEQAYQAMNIRFGERVKNTDGSWDIVDRTPTLLSASTTGMPPVDTATSSGSLWINYVANNAKHLDYVSQGLDFGADLTATENWSWVEWPDDGSPLSPQPWATATSDIETVLKMGVAPPAITVNNMHYMSTTGGKVYLDLRTWDSGTGNEVSLLNAPVLASATLSDGGTVFDTTSPTVENGINTEKVINVSATLPALPGATSPQWGDKWISYEDPDGDGTYQEFTSSWATVWVITETDVNGNGEIDPGERFEHPVDGYRIIDPTPLSQP